MKDFLAQHNFAEPGAQLHCHRRRADFCHGNCAGAGLCVHQNSARSGPKTAIIAGLFAWFGVYFYSGIINGVLFGTPVGTMCNGRRLGAG